MPADPGPGCNKGDESLDSADDGEGYGPEAVHEAAADDAVAGGAAADEAVAGGAAARDAAPAWVGPPVPGPAGGPMLLTYGTKLPSRSSALPRPLTDVFAERARWSIWESEVVLNAPQGRLQLILPLLGPLNLGNVAAAASAGLVLGVPPQSVVAGAAAVDVIPGRGEVLDEGQGFAVAVDAARSPAAVRRLLSSLRHADAKRVLVVAGARGDSPRADRAALGSALHAGADLLFLTNDSPGADWPDRIVADVMAGLPREVRDRNPGVPYPWLQDKHRTPQWYQKWLVQYQAEIGRYVIEDRFSGEPLPAGDGAAAAHGLACLFFF